MGCKSSKQKEVDLESAIKKGDSALPVLIDLLNSGISVNARVNGRSALYLAIQRKQTLTAELLLARGASVKVGYLTETPLHIAAARGNVRVCGKLIEKGASINARTKDGCTPLWLAADKGHCDVVDLLLRQPGIKVDSSIKDSSLVDSVQRTSCLGQAARSRHVNVCEALLRSGANVNLPDINGRTPLHHACSSGNLQLVQLFIRHGCSLHCVDKIGFTPLHRAVFYQNFSAIQPLLQAGCCENQPQPAPGDHLISALHTAAIALNSDLNKRNNDSMTPLMTACDHGNVHCLNKLLHGEMNVDSFHDFDLQRLSRAMLLEENPLVQRWQKLKGSDSAKVIERFSFENEVIDIFPSDRAEEGTAEWSLDYAIWSAMPPGSVWNYSTSLVLHILISAGADLQVKDELQKTALDYAVSRYSLQSAVMLLCHGASMNEERLVTFMDSSALKPKSIMYGFIFPLVLALMWSSEGLRRRLSAWYRRWALHSAVDLPVSVRETLEQPLSLARLCRGAVRGVLKKKSSGSICPLVEQLPVPRALKQFVLLSDCLRLLLVIEDLMKTDSDTKYSLVLPYAYRTARGWQLSPYSMWKLDKTKQ